MAGKRQRRGNQRRNGQQRSGRLRAKALARASSAAPAKLPVSTRNDPAGEIPDVAAIAAAASEPADTRAPALRVWRNTHYALFEAGWMPQSITSWMQRVGVTWLAWELSHSNAWVGADALEVLQN